MLSLDGMKLLVDGVHVATCPIEGVRLLEKEIYNVTSDIPEFDTVTNIITTLDNSGCKYPPTFSVYSHPTLTPITPITPYAPYVDNIPSDDWKPMYPEPGNVVPIDPNYYQKVIEISKVVNDMLVYYREWVKINKEYIAKGVNQDHLNKLLYANRQTVDVLESIVELVNRILHK
jgi:hypothetical protein